MTLLMNALPSTLLPYLPPGPLVLPLLPVLPLLALSSPGEMHLLPP